MKTVPDLAGEIPDPVPGGEHVGKLVGNNSSSTFLKQMEEKNLLDILMYKQKIYLC